MHVAAYSSSLPERERLLCRHIAVGRVRRPVPIAALNTGRVDTPDSILYTKTLEGAGPAEYETTTTPSIRPLYCFALARKLMPWLCRHKPSTVFAASLLLMLRFLFTMKMPCEHCFRLHRLLTVDRCGLYCYGYSCVTRGAVRVHVSVLGITVSCGKTDERCHLGCSLSWINEPCITWGVQGRV